MDAQDPKVSPETEVRDELNVMGGEGCLTGRRVGTGKDSLFHCVT